MRAAFFLMLISSSMLISVAQAGTGSDVLDSVQNDARRSAENSARQAVSKHFPYNGSLYGLPGQTRSSSIREAAIRSAIGGMFGSCKKSGSIDISRGGLDMQVGDILKNTEVKVPDIGSPPTGGLVGNLGGLIPQPSGMPKAEYNQNLAQTEEELRRQQQPQNYKKTAPPAQAPQTQGAQSQPKQVAGPPPVSKIWAPAAK